jgi:hypothetical protein
MMVSARSGSARWTLMAVASVYSESERAASFAPSEAHPASAIVIANKMIYSKFLMSTLLFFLGAKVQN